MKEMKEKIKKFLDDGNGYILCVFVFTFLAIKAKDNLNDKIDYMFVAILFYLDYFRFQFEQNKK
jgi:hypothetical protein